MVEVITTLFEFNILRLYDSVILGFSDNSNADSEEIFTKFDKAATNPKCRHIMFIKAEMEDAKEVFAEYNVDSPPVFFFLKDGEKKDELCVNDPKQLQKKILELLK